MILCKTCKTEKPPSDFLWNGKRGKVRVRICNECAQANMARYWRTRMVGRKPEEFTEAGD